MSEELGTDAAILDSIGEGDEPATSKGTGDEDTGTQADSAQAAPAADSEQGATGQPGTEQPGKVSGPQDLVGADGQVIAAGGKERRFYEAAQKARQSAESSAARVTQLEGQLEAINNAGNVGTQYNLSPEEVTTGAQIIAAWKADPVATIQNMLTQAQSSGHNVDAILSGGGDMAAMKQMLDNTLAPLLSDRQERNDTQERNDQAQQVYNDFTTKHPDATVHENSLARLLNEDSSLSVEAAYFKLQSYYAQKGLDWTKSLETLQAELDTARASSVNTQPQPPEGGSVSPTNVTDTAQVADVSTSTDDIIRQAMEEAGL